MPKLKLPDLKKKKTDEQTEKKETIRKKEPGIIFRHPYESTQMNIPVKDIYKGVIITKDDRYIKIMEVLPIAYLMMTPIQQEKIIYQFISAIDLAPANFQLTAVTLPSNLEAQIEYLHKAMEKETSENCLQMDREYETNLRNSQLTGIRRRFFISFEYERKAGAFRKPSYDMIVNDLNRTSKILAGRLNDLQNDVIVINEQYANYYPAEILYTILNRKKAGTVSYDDHIGEVMQKYYDHFQTGSFYLPPGEYICPDSISYMDRKYVVVDGRYYTFYYIPSEGYNPDVYGGWLTPFINAGDGIDVNIYYHRIPTEFVIEKIRKNLVYSEADMSSVSFASQAMENASSIFSSAQYLRTGILSGEKYYEMAVLITISGNTPEEVDWKYDQLHTISVTAGIKLAPCTYDEEKAFLSSLPLAAMDPMLFQKAKRNVLSSGAASAYPFTTLEINDPKGILVGYDSQTQAMVTVDLFNESRLINYNVFIQGASGAGKTYLESLLMLKMRMLHIPVYMIAPEKEDSMRNIADAVDGQFIQIAPGSPNRINIMEIIPMDEAARKRASVLYGIHEDASFMAEKITTLKSWFSLFIADMTLEESQLLDEALVKTYRRFGITEDNNSLYDPADPNHQRYRRMPIISDLQDELYKRAETRRMANVMSFFVTGSGKSFNGQTNVDLKNELIIFGLEKMKNELRALGLYLIMDFVWAKIREDPTKNKALFIDEWWALGVDPICAAYSMEISKLCREYHGAFIPCTQQLKDIMAVENGKYGEALLGNCATRILLRTEENDSVNVQKILNLTETEREKIVGFRGKGNALFMTGSTKVTIKIKASETEHMIISNSQEDRNRRIARVEKEEAEKLRKEKESIIYLFDDSDVEYLLSDSEYISRYVNNDHPELDSYLSQ